ncbi:MAG TPA: hypothetical protein VGV61_13505, partial [Thermoanaerobaculia bacterium]|nr:hypothetical protein [Thermoanaerobaculia bacterium]
MPARPPRPRPLLDTLPLLAAPAGLALPPLLGGGLVAALLLLWLWRRPSRREAAAAVPLVLLAALALASAGIALRLPSPSAASWVAEATPRYAALWRDIAGHAAAGARAVPRPPANLAERLETHRRLAALLAHGHPDLTLLLVDPDGQPLVWEGSGLLHEPAPEQLPRQGYEFRAGFGAATLLAVAPLSSAPRPWRIVAGRSFETARLPFDPPGWLPPQAYRWSPIDSPVEAAPGALVISGPRAPGMAVERLPALRPLVVGYAPAVAGIALALALLTLAAMRAVALAVLWDTAVPPGHGSTSVAALAVAAAMAGGAAAGAPTWSLVALLTGLAVAAAGWHWGGRQQRPAVAATLGGLVAGGLVALTYAVQHGLGAETLDSLDTASWATDAAGAGLRIGLLGLSAGALLVAAGRSARPEAARGRFAAGAALLLLLAAALHDHPVPALPLLAAGSCLMALWISGADWRLHLERLLPLILLAALLGASAWELADRFEQRRDLASRLLPGMAPPSRGEQVASRHELDDYFGAVDLARRVPRVPDGLAPTDLAYLLWRGSPLDRGNALTALVVVPHGAKPVGFSYGLPLTEAGELDRDPVRWGSLGPPSWRDLLVSGERPLHSAGRSWGVARFWLLPQPGFRLGARRAEDLTVGLLRGGPEARGPTGLPPGVRFGLYGPGGEAEISPWREAPPLPPVLRSRGATRVVTPEGEAWAVAGSQGRGTAVLFLPVLGSWQGLEEVGSLALSMLLLVVAATLLAALLALTRASFRGLLRRAVRSYSKRLLLVYGLLLLVPLAALNVLLLRNLGERLQAEQRAAGEAAVRSAQQVLGEYVLSLEPGFGLETALDDELLVWLSRVLHHEVNLYWGSSINASSKRELFSAGLLSERIPGDIWAQ